MSLTLAVSSPLPPPQPSVTPAPSSPSGSTDPSTQGGRSFSDVLKDTTSAVSQSTTTDSDTTSAAKADPSAKTDATASAPTEKTKSDDGSTDDVDDATAEATADATSNAGQTAGANQAAAKLVTTPADKKTAGKKTADTTAAHATASTKGDDGADAQALLAEQAVSDVDKKQGGQPKSKDGKPTANANSKAKDSSDAADQLAVGSATAVALVKTQAIDKNAASQPDAKGTDATKAAVVPADNESGKSTLRAEQSAQVGGTNGDGSRQKSADATRANATAKADAASAAPSATSDAAAGTTASAKAPDAATTGSASTFDQQLAGAASATKPADTTQTAAAPTVVSLPPAPTAADFAAANHAQIVSSVHTQLLPNGGSIQLRLDPPDLGTMQVTVRMRDGMMSAEFQASNDQAAKLLSHSLGDLKTNLETQGVSVEKLHVSSAPQTRNGGSGSGSRQQRDQTPSEEQQREQQRKEMVRRMWARLSKGPKPLDMVA